MADDRDELLRYALRWRGPGRLLAVCGRRLVAELRRPPGGHLTVTFDAGVSERQRHRLYERLLGESAAGGDQAGDPEQGRW